MKKNPIDPFIISDLIAKALLGDLTTAEKNQFNEWLQESEHNRQIFRTYENEEGLQKDLHFYSAIDMDTSWSKMQNRITGRNPLPQNTIPITTLKSRWNYIKIASIAALMFLIGFAVFLSIPPEKDPGIMKDLTGQFKNDVVPGKNQATLILSNGTEIELQKQTDEIEHYLAQIDQGEEVAATNLYNILRVPKGGTYQMTLLDGTKVWLNSGSEIRFPVHFRASNRMVHMKGEVYFEVAKRVNQPFIVHVNQSMIEVLGTHFNVNSYNNKVLTTLLEGSVKLSTTDASVILKPGELGNIDQRRIAVEKADLRKMMAWKNGEFYFKGDPFFDIITQVALWYDLDVQMDPALKETRITGSINRNVNLSEMLSMLKYITKSNFHLEGRKLTITR